MHRAGQLIGQRRIDGALTLHPAQARERAGDDNDVEVAFPAWGGAGMTVMAGAIVLDIQHFRGKSRFELGSDSFRRGAH